MKSDQLDTYVIPPNFIEGGTLMGGMFKTRNAIEAGILGLAVGVPVFHINASLTARIIILCLTALPLMLFALIGVGGMSLEPVTVVMIGNRFLQFFRTACVAAVGIPIRPHLIVLHRVGYRLIIHVSFPNRYCFDFLPRLLHKLIQLHRMAADLPGIPAIRGLIRWRCFDLNHLRPCNVVPGKAAIILFKLQGIRQDVHHPVFSVFLNDGQGAAIFQPHSIPAIRNRFFNILYAG